MCGGPCCLPLGCIVASITIEKPEGYPEPPAKLMCTKCSYVGKANYRQNMRYCGILFIPCCPCGTEPPFLACSKCNFSIGTVNGETCHRCGVTTGYSASYCPSCGVGRQSVSTTVSNESIEGGNIPGNPDEDDGNPKPTGNTANRRRIGDMHNRK